MTNIMDVHEQKDIFQAIMEKVEKTAEISPIMLKRDASSLMALLELESLTS